MRTATDKFSAWRLLRRKRLGTLDGKTVYSDRMWRAFFLSLLAGGRTVIINAHIGLLDVSGPNGIIMLINSEIDSVK